MRTDEGLNPEDANERALDALLQKARFEEPSLESQERLRQGWIALSRGSTAFGSEAPARRELAEVKRRRGAVMWAVAAAAVVGIVVSVALRMDVRSEDAPNAAGNQPRHLVVVGTTDFVSRAATPYERLLIMETARASARQHAQPKSQPQPRPKQRDTLRQSNLAAREKPKSDVELARLVRSRVASERESAMRQLLARADEPSMQTYLACVSDPATRDFALSVLHESPQPPTDALVLQLSSPLVERRFAAARALGAICSPDLAKRLTDMVDGGTRRREALAALMWCHDPLAVQYLANASRHRGPIDSQIRALKSELSQFH